MSQQPWRQPENSAILSIVAVVIIDFAGMLLVVMGSRWRICLCFSVMAAVIMGFFIGGGNIHSGGFGWIGLLLCVFLRCLGLVSVVSQEILLVEGGLLLLVGGARCSHGGLLHCGHLSIIIVIVSSWWRKHPLRWLQLFMKVSMSTLQPHDHIVMHATKVACKSLDCLGRSLCHGHCHQLAGGQCGLQHKTCTGQFLLPFR